jgi:peptide/nickel transport system permease protein
MTHYLIRRLAQSVFVFAGLITVVFIVARVTGDPTDLYLPLTATQQQRATFRHDHGFDRPIWDQYRDFVGDVAHLDFGTSLWLSGPALPLVLERLPYTLLLATVTIGVSFLVALILGSLGALFPFSWVDRLTSFIALIGVSVADFWLALILIIVFSVKLGILPTSGTGNWTHLILPMVTLAMRPLGTMSQVVRTSIAEQLSAAYVTTAQAKGLSSRRVLTRHVWKNALLSVLTVAGLQLISLANGAVIVETVFGWPGIGKLTIDAITRRDFPIVEAIVFVVALITFLINLATDLCYAAVDPRIRFQ